MAFGLKYTYNFKQLKSYSFNGWKIEIFLDGYGGSSSEIENVSANSIKMSREGSLLEIVQATKLKVSIFNQTEGQYDEFRTARWGEYKLVLTETGAGKNQVRFIGYNQSEIYTEPYEQPPYVSALEFTCGLSHLKHVRFGVSFGRLFTGQKTIIEVLRLCLNELPEPINIREIVNVYEDSISSGTTNSMLSQIYVDSSIYKEVEDDSDSDTEIGFFCNRVIEEILKPFNAHIFMCNGMWHIVRPAEYSSSTLYYRTFLPEVGNEDDGSSTAGSYINNNRDITGVNGLSDEIVLQSSSSELSIQPPLNRIKLTYNQENLDIEESNLMKNSCFKDYNNIGSNRFFPNFWTLTGEDATTYNALYFNSGNVYQLFETNDQFVASNFNSSIYLEQTNANIPVSVLDSMQFSFDIIFRYTVSAQTAPSSNSNAVVNFLRNNLFLRYPVEIQIGLYYLSGNQSAGFTWTLSPSIAIFEKVGFEMSPPGIGQASQTTAIFSIAETLPLLPENGIRDVRLRYYRPYHNIELYDSSDPNWSLNVNILCQKCFKLTYLPNELPATQNLTIYAKIDEDRNEEEINVMHGDGSNTVTLNSFRLADTSITGLWQRRGVSEAKPILEILMDNMRILRGGFRNNLSCLLIGEIELFNTIDINYDGLENYYIENYTYSIETGEYECNLIQLGDTSETQVLEPHDNVVGFNDLTPTVGSQLPEFQIKKKLVKKSNLISGDQSVFNSYN